MKRAIQSSLLLALLCISTMPETGAQEANSPSPRNFRPAQDITVDAEPQVAQVATLTDSIQLTADPKLHPLGELQGFEITVHNASNVALIVQADKATAVSDGTTLSCAGKPDIRKAAFPQTSLSSKVKSTTIGIVAGAATIGAYQTVRDTITQSKPVVKRYGLDEARRQLEATLFGSRVVWPGDTRKGIVYFPPSDARPFTTLKIPIQALSDPSNQAVLTTALSH